MWKTAGFAAFGGDPENITIGGQSAGGMSVSAQIACPANKGLFQRAIIQSGAFYPPYPFEFGLCSDVDSAMASGEAFFDFLGVKTIEEARAIDARTLLQKALAWDGVHGWGKTFGQVIDGVFSTCNGQNWFLQEDRVHCPVLMGSTDCEFKAYPPAKNAADLADFARTAYGEDAEAFLSLFPTDADEETIRRTGEVSSIEFACRIAAETNRQSTEPAPMYSYLFTADIPGWDNPGRFHSVDLWFFFESLAKCWRPFTGQHYELARQMCDYWANFIKTGDPNGPDSNGGSLPLWPEWTAEHPARMNFSLPPKPEACPPDPATAFLLRQALKKLGR